MSLTKTHAPLRGKKWHHHSNGSSSVLRACSNKCLMRSLLLLISMACCSLLLAVNMASDSHHSTAAAVEHLRHLHAEFRGHVPSSYDVADGYWHLDVNYTAPPASLLARTRYTMANSNSSCWDIAAALREPYTAQYHPTQQLPTDLPGGIPRSAWKWQGSITRRLFNSVPFYLRESEAAGCCQHCSFVLRYKVIDGQLYTDRKRRRRALDGQEEEAALLEEMLLAALHMYKVPDVDFLLHLGDGAPPGLPLVQVNINRSNAQAGFTIPKYMWRDALGPQQFQVLAECLQARYPKLPQQRLQRAVWRGSNTDSRHGLMDESNAMSIMRTRLHVFGMWYPDIIDAHYTAFAQQAFQTSCVEELLPPGPTLPLEAFNRYALVLDIDGNGWSDRYRLLAHANTPVLKQASNLTAFFEHLAAPGAVVQYYANDLSDLPMRVRSLLQQPGELARMAEGQQGLAHYLLNQVALMHATAYTLAKVAQLSQWKPVMEDGYSLVPFSKCCSYAKRLPAEFVTAVRVRNEAQNSKTTVNQQQQATA